MEGPSALLPSRGRLDPFDERPQGGVGGDSLQLQLRRHRDSVSQHSGRVDLHIIWYHVVSAVEQGRRLGELEQATLARGDAPRVRAGAPRVARTSEVI